MRTIVLAFLFLCIAAEAFSQSRDTIALMHYFDRSQGMLLKWLPTDKEVFADGMQYGYDLYRAEATGSGANESLGAFQKLNTEPLKHWSLDRFMIEWGKDSTISIAGMLIQTAETANENQVPKDFLQAREEATKKQAEFFIGALGTILNNKAAEALGMYFVDKTADPSKKYVYRIEIIGVNNTASHAIVFPVREHQLGKITGLIAKHDREAFSLSWFQEKNSDFPYFNVYRSEQKNKDFVKLNRRPYLGGSGNASLDKSRVRYIDSFPQYDKTYFYKVVGVNAFGIESVPSEIIQATSFYYLKHSPWVIDVTSPDNQAIDLSWEIHADDAPYIAGFSVKRSSSPDGPYHWVHKDKLSAKTMKFTDKTNKSSSNYYYVCAYGKNGDSLCSIMMSELLIDTFPPARPVITAGTCDTNGIVTVSWIPNAESDLQGYRVFKTYMLEHEPIRMTVDYIPDTVFHDTISLKQPYNTIFYRIYALDFHSNPSLPSEYFEVKIPDINPPTNGYLEGVRPSVPGIVVQWHNSSVYDLAKMHIMRKSKYDLDFVSIRTFSGDSLQITTFTDTATVSGQNYEYAVEAEDLAGLRSDLSKSVMAKQPSRKKILPVTNLQSFVSHENKVVKLVWEFPDNATGFRIYRAVDGKQLETHTFVPGDTREYYDNRVSPGKKYTYLIAAELAGGGRSGFSNTIEVEY